ncbi:MAG: lytic transglycosylase domain-containing protein [Bacteroidales bacterium]|nr:lytic transglycosylase domain-containing protein [Bacteroidales bacterium]
MKRYLLTALAAFLTLTSLDAQPPRVPQSITFAGQTIRFDRPDMFERMDRELITFTYMHTNSTLMLKRSRRIFEEVEPILKEYGIPDDLKYLMAIESNLDPTSLSPAGAAGLWQFMAATGRQYGLEVNSNIDERYNTKKATEAACKYLQDAYKRFGDWMTVAASYNAGMGGISAKLEAQREESALDLWLVTETSRYMFRILAAKMMFENPQSFGFDLQDYDIYPYYPPQEIVTVTDPIPDLVLFAGQHKVSYARLKEANLWLREDKLNNSSHRTYYVTIP